LPPWERAVSGSAVEKLYECVKILTSVGSFAGS